MPWKVSWRVVALAGLAVLMCGGGCSAEAQSTGPAGQAGQQALPPAEAADLWNTVSELRAEVSQLRREVARLQAQVAAPGAGGTGGPGTAQGGAQGAGGSGTAQGTGGSGTVQGTGGSGTAQGGAQGTGGSGTAQGTQPPGGPGTGRATQAPGTGGSGAQGASDVPPPGSEVPSPQGTAVVNAVYTGVVSAVSGQRVVIQREGGTPLTLAVGARTRVLRDGQRIGVDQLQKGEQVRAVVDLVDQDRTVEIAVQPAAPED